MRVETIASGPVRLQLTGRLVIETRGPGFTEITATLSRFVAESGMTHGLAALLCRHTSASLTIQENADPDVRTDLLSALDRFAPRTLRYVHDAEGADDMPAHIRTMLTDASLCVPVVAGRLALGTWQGIYLVEHRDRPHRREIAINLTGT
jgi:secondary thiamine-phosphate synthase enzyme